MLNSRKFKNIYPLETLNIQHQIIKQHKLQNQLIIPNIQQFYQKQQRIMIDKKLGQLKRLISDLDQDKLQNNDKIDSISLISQKLSRGRQSSALAKTNIAHTIQKQSSLIHTHNIQQFNRTNIPKFNMKSKSMKDPSIPGSPLKASKSQISNQFNKKRLTMIARKFYEARNIDMDVKQSQTGWQQFLKTFLLKNSKSAQYYCQKIDISGLGLTGNTMKVASELLCQFKSINLSRNVLNIEDIANIRNSNMIQQLILKNCSMKNEQICTLLQYLLQTPIKKLVLSSPDIKDRNHLTKYTQLYNLIQKSQTLQCLQLSNIQINPDIEIFSYAKRSKSLRRLDLSKNTGVVGICKSLTHLNLSWNNITRPDLLRCLECTLIKLDLTGNLIPSYLFQQFLTTSNFPTLQTLILDKINLDSDCQWLQSYIDKTKTLHILSLISCQLSKTTYLNLIYGLQQNKSIKLLNLSQNKIPSKQIASGLAIAIQKSHVSKLILQQCDIKDQQGQILFKLLDNNIHIQYIDISKNNLSQRTSIKICQSLKKGCYNLLILIMKQNFIKYVQLKQIVGYISRNVYMAKTKIHQQHRKYKNMNTNNIEILKKIQEAEGKVQELRRQTGELEDQFMKKQRDNQLLQAQLIQQRIRLIDQEQMLLEKQKIRVEKQLRKLEGIEQSNPQQP